MALRDQPYFPLYVQDFLTDEKLIECTAQSTGVYIRIMCVMHKSEEYGKILLKQKDKQTSEPVKNFAVKLAKQMPYSESVIYDSLAELLSENVLLIEGDFLIQKRMIHDNSLSLKRAEAGSKGGKFAQAKSKAKPQANTEYEYASEIESEIKVDNKIGDARGKIEGLLFAGINDLYLDGQRPKWQHINFDFEVNSFKEKVRGSPEDYLNHDTNGIRKAFQYQLRFAKTIQHNGSGKGNNKKGDADRATAEAVIEAYSDVFRTGPNGQGSGASA